jgi:hypothetical protein
METTGPAGIAELTRLMRGFQVSKMIDVAVALGLAGRIDGEPRPVADLAVECGAQPDMLERLCRALAAFGVFSVDAQGRIGHSDLSRWLRADAQPTLHHATRFMMMQANWAAWGALEETVRTGRPAFEAVHGMANFDYLAAHPAQAAIFDAFMQHSPDDRHLAVSEGYDFSGSPTVVDVAGGNGALLAAILAANPEARGILFDQEAVVSAAPAVLGGAIDRCEIRSGSFFDAVPAGGDIYTLSQILHDWDDARCLTILANCRAAMGGHGRLLVIERILDPDQVNPVNYLSDMQMMVLFPGARERSLADYTALLGEAGFGAPKLIPTRSTFGILEALPLP